MTPAPLEGWHRFDEGRSIGLVGSECGVIVYDEEHVDGARITIEEGGPVVRYSITCGVYGWMFHTRFCGSRAEAAEECRAMMPELGRLAGERPHTGEGEDAFLRRMGSDLSAFVSQFP
jgi:hypothetical protein